MDDLDLDDDDYSSSLYDDEDEDLPRPRRTGQRIVAAVLLIALLALVIEPTTRMLRRSSPSGERPAADVEGATADAGLAGRPGRSVNDGDWADQVGSAVLIGAAGPNCGGAITLVDGHRLVTSARHCIEEFLPPEFGAELAGDTGREGREVTDRLLRPVEVLDPVSHRRIALLDRVVVGSGATDLLVATTTSEGPDFAARPARRVDLAPVVGDEVATFASSGADGFRPRRLTGVYLGVFTFTGPDELTHVVDLIGYRQPASSTLLGRGHSGHSPTGAGRTAFGPVLYSLNAETPPSQRVEELRQMSADTGIALEAEGFVGIEETLHLDPSEYLPFAALLR